MGYNENSYIVSIKSVASLSESQLRIFNRSYSLGLSLFLRERFSKSGLIKSLVNSATGTLGCL